MRLEKNKAQVKFWEKMSGYSVYYGILNLQNSVYSSLAITNGNVDKIQTAATVIIQSASRPTQSAFSGLIKAREM